MTRLIGSRIAYPAATIMILLLQRGSQINFEQEKAKQFFDKIIEENDLKRLGQLFKEKKSLKGIQAHKQQQAAIFDLQAKAQIQTLEFIEEIGFKHERVTPFKDNIQKSTYYNKIIQKEEKARSNIFEYKSDAIIGFKNLQKGKSDLVELEPFYDFSLRTQFDIDQGVPYFDKHKHKILSLNERPVNRYDPLKPIRIASLFGWQISSINNEIELNDRLEVK